MAEGVDSQLSEEGQSNWPDMVHPDRQEQKPLGLNLEDLLYLNLRSQQAEYIKYRDLTCYSPECLL